MGYLFEDDKPNYKREIVKEYLKNKLVFSEYDDLKFEDQERCSGWMEKCADKVPTLDEEYQKFIEKMMTPLREFSVLKSLTSEEMEEFMKSLREE